MDKKDIILRIENISKQYRLGTVGTGTLSHDLNRLWHKVRGKDDPYLKVGEVNDRSSKATSDYVWALQDINFEVERGEVLGIIGKNGAGKSTLLKILSKVTAPTTGSIKSRGRIASLLEVGTGFNPELTGRENIYLNGAILGMTKKEITSKLNEIIEFSGCERYVDTPTKRYSSGMTVRLAFAVAAFLEPEILVVDEVLAVGDAEFQKKAIGKMQDISREGGRTVLFVSHNMASVRTLCTRGIVLENGLVKFNGGIEQAIDLYFNDNEDVLENFDFNKHNTSFSSLKFSDFHVKSIENKEVSSIKMGDKISFKFQISAKVSANFTVRITLFDINDNRVLAFDSADLGEIFTIKQNESKVVACFPEHPLFLKSGNYKINISIKQGAILLDHITKVKILQVVEYDIFGFGRFSPNDMPIIVTPHRWT